MSRTAKQQQCDQSWARYKAASQDVADIYRTDSRKKSKAERVHTCSDTLISGLTIDDETGEIKKHIRSTCLCHVRHCPICEWRKMVRTRVRFRKAFPKILEKHPAVGFIFLTLTGKNCHISDLRSTIQAMNKAWNRLKRHREFCKVMGWLRFTEVTNAENGMAHPHFHCLLMVPSSCLSVKGDYITTIDWRTAWGEALKVNYLPEVKNGGVRSRDTESIAKILNYIAKNPDVPDHIDREWLLVLTEQTYRLRFIVAGGLLKTTLKDAEKEKIKPHETTDSIYFSWHREGKRYNILDNI
jgi:plasmid rolling circle replication initiator protein Rep